MNEEARQPESVVTDGPDGTRKKFKRRTTPKPGWSRARVRLVNLIGCVLIGIGMTGWWLGAHVIDDDGFASNISSAMRDKPVRDYAADEISIRLARSVPAVAAARPVVSAAIAEALRSPAVELAVRSALRHAHHQAFKVNSAHLAALDSAQASENIRAALQAVSPDLANKLPANFWTVSTRLSQSKAVAQISRWGHLIETIALPAQLLGFACLAFAVRRAREMLAAVRAGGYSLAITGALLIGVTGAVPVLALFADVKGGLRAEAAAAVAERFFGPLGRAGEWLLLLGLFFALAPSRHGDDVRQRFARLFAWFRGKGAKRRWRVSGAILLVFLGAGLREKPMAVGRNLLHAAGFVVAYIGVVYFLNAVGVPVLRATAPRVRKRSIVAVGLALVVSFASTAGGAYAVVQRVANPKPKPAAVHGCNGYVELCFAPLNQLVWAGSHNAMSNSADNFLSAEHTISITDQLNAGDRALLVDLYYGYDDEGIVRTNLAGGVDRGTVVAEQGQDALDALDRLGALTGTVDTSGKHKDVYMCHSFCELGASKAVDEFVQIGKFLERNVDDVVIVVIEDYVQPADVAKLLKEAKLDDRVWSPAPGATAYPTLLEIVTPPTVDEHENPRRLVVMSEHHGGEYPWYLPAYGLMEETPFTFPAVKDFTCAPNRGADGRHDFLLVNHWIRSGGAPSPVEAKEVNAKETLDSRIQDCIATRHRLPSIVATDFTEIGDLQATVARYNGAHSVLAGWTKAADDPISTVRANQRANPTRAGSLLQDLDAVRRLPVITDGDARAMVGTALAQAFST